jgi:hypothetical protein
MYHILSTQAQRDCLPHGAPSDFNHIGTVVAGVVLRLPRKDGAFVLMSYLQKKSHQ